MKKLFSLMLLLPLAVIAAEHGGKAMKSKEAVPQLTESAGKAAEHGGQPVQEKAAEQDGEPVQEKAAEHGGQPAKKKASEHAGTPVE